MPLDPPVVNHVWSYNGALTVEIESIDAALLYMLTDPSGNSQNPIVLTPSAWNSAILEASGNLVSSSVTVQSITIATAEESNKTDPIPVTVLSTPVVDPTSVVLSGQTLFVALTVNDASATTFTVYDASSNTALGSLVTGSPYYTLAITEAPTSVYVAAADADGGVVGPRSAAVSVVGAATIQPTLNAAWWIPGPKQVWVEIANPFADISYSVLDASGTVLGSVDTTTLYLSAATKPSTVRVRPAGTGPLSASATVNTLTTPTVDWAWTDGSGLTVVARGPSAGWRIYDASSSTLLGSSSAADNVAVITVGSTTYEGSVNKNAGITNIPDYSVTATTLTIPATVSASVYVTAITEGRAESAVSNSYGVISSVVPPNATLSLNSAVQTFGSYDYSIYQQIGGTTTVTVDVPTSYRVLTYELVLVIPTIQESVYDISGGYILTRIPTMAPLGTSADRALYSVTNGVATFPIGMISNYMCYLVAHTINGTTLISEAFQPVVRSFPFILDTAESVGSTITLHVRRPLPIKDSEKGSAELLDPPYNQPVDSVTVGGVSGELTWITDISGTIVLDAMPIITVDSVLGAQTSLVATNAAGSTTSTLYFLQSSDILSASQDASGAVFTIAHNPDNYVTRYDISYNDVTLSATPTTDASGTVDTVIFSDYLSPLPYITTLYAINEFGRGPALQIVTGAPIADSSGSAVSTMGSVSTFSTTLTLSYGPQGPRPAAPLNGFRSAFDTQGLLKYYDFTDQAVHFQKLYIISFGGWLQRNLTRTILNDPATPFTAIRVYDQDGNSLATHPLTYSTDKANTTSPYTVTFTSATRPSSLQVAFVNAFGVGERSTIYVEPPQTKPYDLARNTTTDRLTWNPITSQFVTNTRYKIATYDASSNTYTELTSLYDASNNPITTLTTPYIATRGLPLGTSAFAVAQVGDDLTQTDWSEPFTITLDPWRYQQPAFGSLSSYGGPNSGLSWNYIPTPYTPSIDPDAMIRVYVDGVGTTTTTEIIDGATWNFYGELAAQTLIMINNSDLLGNHNYRLKIYTPGKSPYPFPTDQDYSARYSSNGWVGYGTLTFTFGTHATPWNLNTSPDTLSWNARDDQYIFTPTYTIYTVAADGTRTKVAETSNRIYALNLLPAKVRDYVVTVKAPGIAESNPSTPITIDGRLHIWQVPIPTFTNDDTNLTVDYMMNLGTIDKADLRYKLWVYNTKNTTTSLFGDYALAEAVPVVKLMFGTFDYFVTGYLPGAPVNTESIPTQRRSITVGVPVGSQGTATDLSNYFSSLLAATNAGVLTPTELKANLTTVMTGFTAPATTIQNIDITPLIDTTKPLAPGITLADIAASPITVLPMQPGKTVTIPTALPANTILYIPGVAGDSTTWISGGQSYSISLLSDGVIQINDAAYSIGDWCYFGGQSYQVVFSGSAGLRQARYVPCFLAGAPILTPTGPQRIDSLREGDLVQTSDGRDVAIQRIVRTRVEASHATNPYVIPQGLFGATKRLLISPNHKVLVPGRGMVEARYLGLRQDERSGTIDYYNLELPAPTDCLVVAGVVAESMAHVRRIVISAADFERVLIQKYGRVTPAILEMVKRTCVVLPGGRVAVPATRR